MGKNMWKFDFNRGHYFQGRDNFGNNGARNNSYMLDGIEVRIGSEDWDGRLGRLGGVLAQLRASGQSVTSIDLRFRDQVLRHHVGEFAAKQLAKNFEEELATEAKKHKGTKRKWYLSLAATIIVMTLITK